MPKNATILLIRHGEKPATSGDVRLTTAGAARAQAYIVSIPQYLLAADVPSRLRHIVAAADSTGSHRSRLTVDPLSQALGLPVDATHADADFPTLAAALSRDARYDDGATLVCWHHENLLAIALALGVRPERLPHSATWPEAWPADVFGWLLQICFDADGAIIPAQTCCRNQRLMYGDHGQDPPQGT
jgi:hypothetical protein